MEVTMVGRVLLGWGRWEQALGTAGFRLQPDLPREAQERGRVASLMGLKAKVVSQTPLGPSTPSLNGSFTEAQILDPEMLASQDLRGLERPKSPTPTYPTRYCH